ncbi:fungal-specific transcription factor domain-containing protein, partial [Phyllosticta citribraziliensis]
MPTPPSLLSCHNCRARKVRCDKERPCGNCQRSKSECVFPLQRAARRKQGRRHEELLRRLDHLESLVDGLGGEVAITARQSTKQDSDEPEDLHEEGSEVATERGTEWMTGVVKPLLLAPRGEHHGPREDGSYPVMKGDGGRYLGEDFWTSLSGEVEGLRELLNEPTSDDEEDASTHFSSPPVGGDHYEKRLMNSLFLFSGDMETTDLRWLHPPGPHIEALSNIYWDRVDVIFKVLHRPTVNPLLKSAAADSLAIPKGGGEEALMFAIYFAAVTTLSSTECLEILGRDKPTVVGQTRHCLEIALSNADFLNSTDMQVLQAFVLYLVCLRSHNKTRSAWTLVALAVRIGQDLNLHRDGALTGFSPYETEMRRRLWWQLVVLDIRACEDRGSFPLISLELCSTKVPLNINDEDIEPNTRSPPAEREGYTEMTFSKLCQEASAVAPKFFSPIPANIDDEHKRDHWQHQIQEEVEHFKDKMQEMFLNYCKPEVPIQYVVIKVVQIILTEFWLLVHYPIQTRRFAFKSKATKKEVLEAAVAHLEIDYEVVMHPLSTKFSWYFDTYVEWHPIAVALAELCVQTRGPLVEKAWKVVDTIYERARSLVTDVSLWRPVKKLYQKARLAREQAIREDAEKSQQIKQSPSQQSMSYSPPAPSSKPRPSITT